MVKLPENFLIFRAFPQIIQIEIVMSHDNFNSEECKKKKY